MRLASITLVACMATSVFSVRAGGTAEPGSLTELAHLAVEGPPTRQAEARERLREAGYDGLKALLAKLPADSYEPPGPDLAEAVDAVAGQKDAWASRLYWHTDLETAKATAEAQNKPILSLRLLGRLDENLSCANSRFFRTALYPDERIAQLLREHFVLHWESVRPVPVVTVDFGDGRTVRRTLTGNSIHYVLTPQGEVIDAIPGLYGPGEFRRQLIEADQWVRDWAAFKEDLEPREIELAKVLSTPHSTAMVQADRRWTADLTAIGAVDQLQQLPDGVLPQSEQPQDAPPATDAGVRTASKIELETPLLEQVVPDGQVLAATMTHARWRQIAALHLDDARLSPRAIAVMKSKLPADVATDPAALALVRERFEKSMALDTVINEYTLRRQIRQWFIDGEVEDLASLNERVYAEVFLTPSSDPWLGLAMEEVYTGIPDAGLTEPTPLTASSNE